MKSALGAAAFAGRPIASRNAEALIDRGADLLEQARRLAGRDRGRSEHDDDRRGG
jgi:hypothetical protein